MTNFDIEISKVFVSSPFKIRRVSDAGMGKYCSPQKVKIIFCLPNAKNIYGRNIFCTDPRDLRDCRIALIIAIHGIVQDRKWLLH